MGSGYPVPVLVEREPQGVPSSWGTPTVPTPCSSTPAGPATPSHEVRRRGPRSIKDEGSPRVVLSGLHSTAWALAVYASSSPLPGRDARLASGRWPGSTGWACLPTGFLRKVSEGSRYISSPFPKLAWRNNRSRAGGNKRTVPETHGERQEGQHFVGNDQEVTRRVFLYWFQAFTRPTFRQMAHHRHQRRT